MKKRRLWWIGAGIVVLALILAFPLHEAFQRTVVVPLAFFLWSMGLFYRSMPQLVWWILAVIIVSVMLVGSITPSERYAPSKAPKTAPPQGQVEGLAVSIQKAQRGVYFKWLVANRLGKLAFQMLLRREGDLSRSVFAPLLGADWEPTPLLQKYLETGLHGSFSDYPESERFLQASASPLDVEISEAVEFLESHLENRS